MSKVPRLDQDTFHVRHKRCESCIFGKRSPISHDSLEDRLQRIEATGGYQECHAFTIRHGHDRTGPGVACRGFWDTQSTLVTILARILDNVVFVDDDGQPVRGG